MTRPRGGGCSTASRSSSSWPASSRPAWGCFAVLTREGTKRLTLTGFCRPTSCSSRLAGGNAWLCAWKIALAVAGGADRVPEPWPEDASRYDRTRDVERLATTSSTVQGVLRGAGHTAPVRAVRSDNPQTSDAPETSLPQGALLRAAALRLAFTLPTQCRAKGSSTSATSASRRQPSNRQRRAARQGSPPAAPLPRASPRTLSPSAEVALLTLGSARPSTRREPQHP
jgi:hypothetical protein